MTRAARITQADITRAVKSARDAGLVISEIILEPNRATLVTIAAPLAITKEARNIAPKEWPQRGD